MNKGCVQGMHARCSVPSLDWDASKSCGGKANEICSAYRGCVPYGRARNDIVWNEGKGVDNVLNTDPGLSTGLILEIGDVFQVDVVNPNDTWNFCSPTAACTVDADGRRPALGTFFGTYRNSGYSENLARS